MNLAIAFGARGSGGALAHYEPARNVINLTKMKGAGCLAHEWGHALDNKIGRECGARSYFTESYCRRESNPELYDAMEFVVKNLKQKVMGEREYVDHIKKTVNRVSSELVDLKEEIMEQLNELGAAENHIETIEGILLKFVNMNEDVEWAVEINKVYEELRGASSESKGVSYSECRETVRQFFSLYAHNKAFIYQLKEYSENGTITHKNTIKTKYFEDACKLDKGRSKPYYSTTVEMFARAFEAYVYDKMKAVGFNSQYLVHSVSSEIYEEKGMGSPYPCGDDRKALFNAFNRLMDAYRNTVLGGAGFQYSKLYSADSFGNDTYTNEKLSKKNVKKAVMNGELSTSSSAEDIRNKVDSMNKEDVREVSSIKDINNSTDLRSFISYNVKNIRKERVKLKDLYSKLESQRSKHWEELIPVNERQGHTKSWCVKSGSLVIHQGATDEKKCEAIVEAVTSLMIRGNTNEIEMVREGVIFTLCKMYKLDVRTYCADKRFDSLCRDTKSLEQYLDIVIKKAAELNKILI